MRFLSSFDFVAFAAHMARGTSRLSPAVCLPARAFTFRETWHYYIVLQFSRNFAKNISRVFSLLYIIYVCRMNIFTKDFLRIDTTLLYYLRPDIPRPFANFLLNIRARFSAALLSRFKCNYTKILKLTKNIYSQRSITYYKTSTEREREDIAKECNPSPVGFLRHV